MLHGLCSILVFCLLRRLVSRGAALGGALLFAVHPIHAEAVTTIYGQQDLLAALFFLAAAVASLGLAAPGAWGVGAAVGSLYLLSLLCKEQGVLLPALLPVLRLQAGFPGNRLLRFERRDIAMVVSLGIFALLRMEALDTQVVPPAESSVAYGYPWWARINLVIVTVGTYVRLLVVPWGQTTYYGHLRDSLFGVPVLEFVMLLGAVALFRPLQHLLGRSVVVQAYAFLGVTLLPVANLLPIGMVVGERCLYLPAFAVCLLAGAAIHRAAGARARLSLAMLTALVLAGVILSARVALRWRTPLIHWETTAIDHPRSAGAHARFALFLLHEAALDLATPDDPRLARAEQAIQRASQINDRLPEAWHARGALAIMRGDCAVATPALERALALRPGDGEIARLLRTCR